jgi:predicted GNAT superfamily acetyltransferase
MNIEQRGMTPEDGNWFLDLNNSEVPHVNNLDQDALNGLLAEASLSLVIDVDGMPAAGLIAFEPGAGYASANYRWYSDNYDAFFYVDRIVVDSTYRGNGLARQLYDQAWKRAQAQGVMLCCEVNEDPPNEASMRFHERFGFKPVGGQQTEGGKKTVVLLARMPVDQS